MIAVRRARRLLHRFFFVFHNPLGKIKASGVEEAAPVAIYYSFCEGRIVPTHRRDAAENQRSQVCGLVRPARMGYLVEIWREKT